MKLGRVIVLGVGIAAGLVAAILAVDLTTRSPETTPQPETKVSAEQVLVAAKDIVMGKTVSADVVTWQDWPKGGVSGNFILRSANPDAMTAAVGAIARSTFYAGEPITEAKLIRTDRGYM